MCRRYSRERDTVRKVGDFLSYLSTWFKFWASMKLLVRGMHKRRAGAGLSLLAGSRHSAL